MSNETTTMTFGEKVKAFLNLDDASRVNKFQKQALAVWNEQIDIRKKDIEKAKETLAELSDESAQEIVLNIDVESIKTIKDREEYLVDTYQQRLMDLIKEEEEIQANIATLEKEIEGFQKLIAKMQ